MGVRGHKPSLLKGSEPLEKTSSHPGDQAGRGGRAGFEPTPSRTALAKGDEALDSEYDPLNS